jgi:hypothetical protein
MAVEFCRKILRHGTDGFTSPPKKVVLWILTPLKIHCPRPSLNPRTLGPVPNTLPLDHRGWRCMKLNWLLYVKHQAMNVCKGEGEEKLHVLDDNWRCMVILNNCQGKEPSITPLCILKFSFFRWFLKNMCYWIAFFTLIPEMTSIFIHHVRFLHKIGVYVLQLLLI